MTGPANPVIDKVIAITGASRGIGAATARLLAGRGASVVLGARSEAGMASLAADISDDGGRVVTCPTDVCRRADLHRLVAKAGSEFGRLDVLVQDLNVKKLELV